MSLQGRKALITGSSRGIGRATAEALAREGADVAVAARGEEELRSLSKEVAGRYVVDALPIPTDVRDPEEVKDMVERTVEEFGGLDVLVNNAGLARGGDLGETSLDDYRTMTDTNVDGTFYATREAAPHLVDSGGNLIFIGSFAGKFPRPFNPVYSATKWWTRGFAHSVEARLGPKGVAVTVINPSEVRTDFRASSGETYRERFAEGEVTEPEEVAEAVVFAAERSCSAVSELDLYRRDKLSDL